MVSSKVIFRFLITYKSWTEKCQKLLITLYSKRYKSGQWNNFKPGQPSGDGTRYHTWWSTGQWNDVPNSHNVYAICQIAPQATVEPPKGLFSVMRPINHLYRGRTLVQSNAILS